MPECNYPCRYIKGITVFWQNKDCPDECTGILPFKEGLNFVPWVEFKFLIDVPVTNVEDSFFRYYIGNVWTVESAIAKLIKTIGEKRNSKGFQISPSALSYINEKVANYNVHQFN